MDIVTGLLIGLIAGAAVCFVYFKTTTGNAIMRGRQQAEELAKAKVVAAENTAKEIELTARQKLLNEREALEAEFDKEKAKLSEIEARLTKREDHLDRKLDTLTVKERNLDERDARLGRREQQIEKKDNELTQVLASQKQRLLEISGLSMDAAKELLLARVEAECSGEVGAIVQKYVDRATDEGKEKARSILLQAIQKQAGPTTSDHTVSSIAIADEAMKGRVIGREGRNIRAFEKQTGVDVIIDDTPGVIIVSCFDPVRRETARMAMERLIVDGRIHPARIEEIVTQTAKDMEEELLNLGKRAAEETRLPNLPRPILPLLGRLHFRTSYGQNVLRHSQEVGHLCQVMADELGLDGTLARRAGLLHDIGKAMDHEAEGSHPQLGHDFLKKLGEHEAILNAALAHHGDVPASTPYTSLVMAADAISASRPGARRESLERYVKRLTDLEDLANAFDGVRQTYAISAGREVRVIVDAHRLDDRASAKLARDIAKRVEEQMNYPGEIKVTVLREVRSVEYAR